ncbi:MAG: SIR2 family protein [bacterium]|nr:SIR2 family protein [bacterium]
MTEQKLSTPRPYPAFRAPGADDWGPLQVDNDDDVAQKEDAKSNKDELNNMLLTSLQMQHLAVLAGLGCSLSVGGPSMLDLWNDVIDKESIGAAAAIATKVNHDLTDKNIETFLSRVEASLHVNNDNELDAFLNASKMVILDRCSRFVGTERLDAHMTFLHRLSRRRVRDQRLKVFTTNYDLCFERAAGKLGEVALDGFSFAAPRRYDPRFFSYDIIRRPHSGDDLGNYLEGVFLLYKLHGSVNWSRADGGAIFEKEEPKPEEACLIYPARGKYQQSFTQPYLESMAQYLAAVREPNTCVLVVGFGFNDNHLAEPLLAATRSNPHLRLIIVDPAAESKTMNGNQYWAQFAELSAHGEDIWFISAGFEDFAQIIPDLKSLTPADTLMKAIQGVTRDQ